MVDLRQLQSRAIGSALKSHLPRHGVALTDLKNDIRNLVAGLSGVRFGRKLTATYQIAGGTFKVPTSSAVDAATRTIFVSSDADAALGFYGALAAYLFRSGSSPQNAWGLMTMVRERRAIDQLRFLEQEEWDDEPIVAADDAPGDEHHYDDAVVRSGHGERSERLAVPKAPQPMPLSPIGKATYLASGNRSGARVSRGSSTDSRRNSLEEQEHIQALKADHYAWHCQACLGAHEVMKAAPVGTYVYSPSYRKRLIEAHHVQHLQNAGGLGGGNLLIFCNYHHDLLGDELSREGIQAALSSAMAAHRKFPTDMLGKTTIKRDGLLATVSISKEPFHMPLFFTEEHRKIWMEDKS